METKVQIQKPFDISDQKESNSNESTPQSDFEKSLY